jgi:hypothetical protein
MIKDFLNFELTEEKVYSLIVCTYILIGLLYTFVDKYIPPRYLLIIMLCLFKMIYNYRKCTFSYLECKIRGVNREDGILNSLLEHIVNLRNSKYKYILYTIAAILLLNAPFGDLMPF